MILSCFNPFYNYLVVSTVTYSVKIYTPNTNLNDVYQVEVKISGEDYQETQITTVLDHATTPATETEEYVIYQILEAVRSRFQTLTRMLEIRPRYSGVFLSDFKVFRNVGKHCYYCFVYLLNGETKSLKIVSMSTVMLSLLIHNFILHSAELTGGRVVGIFRYKIRPRTL